MTAFTDEDARRLIATVPHWYHCIEVRPGIVTPGLNAAGIVLQHLELPDDCRGMRALDIGTRDGFFAFELERRGADVVAVDYMPSTRTGFGVASQLLGSRVRFVHGNIYELTPDELGTFDVVLFLGLLYHLPDPFGAMEIVRRLCHGVMCLESHAIDNGLLQDGELCPLPAALTKVPLMQFYPGRSLNNDPTNFWGPNLACLEALARETRFEVRSSHLVGARAIVNCRAIEDQDRAFYNAMARGRP
jgi:tRNA (mo5U34)-methyltransferase